MRISKYFSAILVVLITGCTSTSSLKTFQPANNETVLNMMAAGYFMDQLRITNALSGFNANDHGELMNIPACNPPPTTIYPIILMFTAKLNSQPNNIYWFSVSRTNKQAEWRMEKSWKTDEKGNILVPDLPLPSEIDQKEANQVLQSGKYKNAEQGLSTIKLDPVPNGKYSEANLIDLHTSVKTIRSFANSLKGLSAETARTRLEGAAITEGEWKKGVLGGKQLTAIYPDCEIIVLLRDGKVVVTSFQILTK